MADLLRLKEDHFVLWRPDAESAPKLVIGTFRYGNPSGLDAVSTHAFAPHPQHPDLWIIPLQSLPAGLLEDGKVYHYFFEVTDSNPYKAQHRRIWCTDPTAWTVDWRLRAPAPEGPYGDGDLDPAAVVMFAEGKLRACDAGGELPDWGDDTDNLAGLAPNNQLVIYELPTSWSRMGERDGREIDVGSFLDVLALVDAAAAPVNFSGIAALEGRAHLVELGVNALELLPPADSWVDRQWGYATSNYFAADYDLGSPFGHSWSTATTDLTTLVRACHARGIRFFADMAMGFANHCPLENINFMDFHVRETDNPHAVDPEKDDRHNWGGQLFKYNYRAEGYDPVSGSRGVVYPARRFMLTQLAHWLHFYRIDGIRMDSIKTIMNWDFVQEFKDAARNGWTQRAHQAGLQTAQAEARFIVVGEVLDHQQEKELVSQQRVDGVWNDEFKSLLRHAILGRHKPDTASFEQTVRKMIDCRMLGYSDGAQVVNYIGSHDTEGYQNERIYNFLQNNNIYETEQRIKLAFTCLLTAVGIPMILAGDEFAEVSDLEAKHPYKQMDAVNFDRLADAWRQRVFDYVARLVRFRVASQALAVNETDFIHIDCNDGKRVFAWRRGFPASVDQVVVVANFSGWGTADPWSGRAEYVVHNWPATPPGRSWREITLDRPVPAEWVGREPLFPWEAKVYATV